MALYRRLLFRSDMWEIARPRHPLTAGHLLIRLSDPSTEFAEPSAADWLLCHGLARVALRDVLGAHCAALMFAHNWHPLGSSVGEPVAESSTPTFHLFGRWKGETTTPGRQLSLPAHRRVAEPEANLDVVDTRIRDSLRLTTSGSAEPGTEAGLAPRPGAGVVPLPPQAPLPPPVPLVATVDHTRHHSVIEPASGAGSIADVQPGELVSIAEALATLPLTSGLSGFSCVVVESGEPGAAVRVHAVGRSGAEESNPMLELFRLPEVSLALL